MLKHSHLKRKELANTSRKKWKYYLFTQRWIISTDKTEKMIYSNGLIIKMIIWSNDGYKLEFRDFFFIIGLPLRTISKDFQVEAQKWHITWELENWSFLFLKTGQNSLFLLQKFLKVLKEEFINTNWHQLWIFEWNC